MTSYVQQIAAAVRATRFRSSTELLWLGRSAHLGLPPRLRRALTPGELRACVLASLQDRLYEHFYRTGATLPSFDGQSLATSDARSAMFVQQLSEANCGTGYLEPGWEVRRVTPTLLFVRRYGLEMHVPRFACQLPPESDPSVGVTVNLRMPKELTNHLAGCYLAMSDRWFSDGEWSRLVRIYWNLTPHGAIALVRQATRELNAGAIPFQLKVFSELARTSRADGAVLYLHKESYEAARPILESIVPLIAAQLRSAVPTFTKRLAPGVGLGEDPGNGLSFGEHRCGLIAEALVQANDTGRGSVSDRVEIVLEHLRREGISPDAPYLNPGSEDVYDFGVDRDAVAREMSVAGRDEPVVRTADSPSDAARYVHTAHDIGHRICADAKWSGDRCNWMGSGVDRFGRASAVALDPCLYAGTSGVALFLAELHAATDDSSARTTSLAAIEQSLARADSVPAVERISLFTGWIGIALATARIGVVLQRDDLLVRARTLLARLEWNEKDVEQVDHLSGAAGAIVGLLALQELLNDCALGDVAARLGDVVLERAGKAKTHWSWRTINTRRQMNLTGLSHGTAGIACAFLELYRWSGDSRYRHAADMAFAYERQWFSADAGNWPDLRGYPARGVHRRDMLPCGTMWCHGAAGIALSRLRAYEITRDERLVREALIALETTHTVTGHALQMSTMNFSLCHGLAGNAEILLLGAAALEPGFQTGSALAIDIATAGIVRYARTGEPWPSGDAGPTPAFMTGSAGMGYWYLRLANPAIPSLLLLNPERWAAPAAYACPVSGLHTAAFPG